MTIPQFIIGANEGNSVRIRILVVDDHPLLRQALRSVLEKQPDFQVIAEAGDGEEAVRLATELVPDVVIMDVSMPKINGLEATRQIKKRYPQISILALTVHDDTEDILAILEAGAAGYLTKKVFGDEVINAVRAVAAGDTVLSPDVSERIIKHGLRNMSEPDILTFRGKITTRELMILRMVAKGLSNKTIAQDLQLSERTIKAHLAEIFYKLNVTSRTEAVVVALRGGILTMDDIRDVLSH